MGGKRALWAATIFLLPLSVSLSLAKGDKTKEAKGEANPPNYYPLQAGNEWHYKVVVNGQNSTVTTRIAKIETIDGVPMARLETSGAPLVEHLMQNDKGVFRTRFNGAEITPSFQLMPYPVKLGAKWKGSFVVQGEKNKNEYDGEIGPKEETIEVPAGKYQTIRVRVKLGAGEQQVDTTFWFAKNVGIVKQSADIAGSSFTLELEKFENKKKVEDKTKAK